MRPVLVVLMLAAALVGAAHVRVASAAPSRHAAKPAARAQAEEARAARARAYRRRRALVRRVVSFARHQVGVPYRWGGTTRASGYDCSGFVLASYRSIGRSLPRTTWGMMGVGRRVSWAGLRPGDVLFTSGGGHVALVVSRTMTIAAPHAGAQVRYEPLSWSRSSFAGGRRIIGASPA